MVLRWGRPGSGGEVLELHGRWGWSGPPGEGGGGEPATVEWVLGFHTP